MKRFILTVVILSCVIMGGQAQEKLKIGDIFNGKLKVTNESALNNFFLNNIGKTGSLDKELKVTFSPTQDRVFVYKKVTGNKAGITSVGVMLVNISNEANIVPNNPDSQPIGPGVGGSVTVTCAGNPCTQCTPVVDWQSGGWMPSIYCQCLSPEGHCNQNVTLTFNVNIGM